MASCWRFLIDFRMKVDWSETTPIETPLGSSFWICGSVFKTLSTVATVLPPICFRMLMMIPRLPLTWTSVICVLEPVPHAPNVADPHGHSLLLLDDDLFDVAVFSGAAEGPHQVVPLLALQTPARQVFVAGPYGLGYPVDRQIEAFQLFPVRVPPGSRGPVRRGRWRRQPP